MKYGSLILERKDFVMIKSFLQLNHYLEDYAHKDALESLEENMANALIFDLDEMPDDVIRLSSHITVSNATGWSKTFQLVLPTENNMHYDKKSVQSSLGASVIGLSEGDEFRIGLPGDIRTLKIKKVDQCEERIAANIPEEILTKVLPKPVKNQIPITLINI